MRRLGDELGVRAMAMYRHVRDKDELLDLVIDGVLADVDTIEPTGDWRSDAIRIAGSVRQAMQRHRNAVALLASRPWVGRAGLRGIDVTIGVFRRAGLPDRDAIHAQFALGNYVSGFSAWEAANLGAAGEDPDARRAALARYRASIAELPSAEYPALAAVGDELVGGTLDDRFAAGLAFLLDGIAARIADGSADRADGPTGPTWLPWRRAKQPVTRPDALLPTRPARIPDRAPSGTRRSRRRPTRRRADRYHRRRAFRSAPCR